MNVFRKSFLRKFALFAAVALAVVAVPVMTHAQLVLSIGIAPPPLPVYTQPACPQVGYLWTPGYWAYGPDGYFWIPGTGVQPPTVGVLWGYGDREELETAGVMHIAERPAELIPIAEARGRDL